jgi:hypothetical protein
VFPRVATDDLSRSTRFFYGSVTQTANPQSYVRTATTPTSRIKVTVMKQWIPSTNAIVLSAVSGAAPAALHANARQRVKILEQSLSYAEEATVLLPLPISRHDDNRLCHQCAQWRSG